MGKKAEISKKVVHICIEDIGFQAPKEKTNVLHTSKEVEAQIEREASEVFNSILRN